MPESKLDPNSPKVTIGDAFASLRQKKNPDTQTPPPGAIEELYRSIKQKVDTSNLLELAEVAQSGARVKGTQQADPIDQLSRLNQSLGVNVAEMMKEQRQAAIDAHNAKTEAEAKLADMKFDLLGRALADVRAESQGVIKRIEEILKDKQTGDQGFLFGLADKATGGKYTQQYLDRTFGQPEKPVDPLDHAMGVIERAEAFKRQLGLVPAQTPERVPLEENIEYHRLILEDKRFTETEKQKLAVEERRIKALESFTDKVESVIEDVIAGYMASRGGGNGKSATRDKKAPEPEQQQGPQEQIKLEWGAISCPNPDCRSHKFNPPATIAWPTNAPKGFKGQCVYCEVVLGDDGKV